MIIEGFKQTVFEVRKNVQDVVPEATLPEVTAYAAKTFVEQEIMIPSNEGEIFSQEIINEANRRRLLIINSPAFSGFRKRLWHG